MNEEEMKERKQQEDEKVPQALIIQNSKFIIHNYLFGGLAQLARASALQAEGQRFESVILHHGKSQMSGCAGVLACYQAELRVKNPNDL